MMFIRQLGLKAYMDFPGAIHTRYSHALGTMHLAGRLTDLLILKMEGKRNIVENLKSNKNNIMAAGFFHDIGHAPFSHAADYVMKTIMGKSHEEMCGDILKQKIPHDVEKWGISKDAIINMVNPKSHEYQFLSQIINGPLDCDKLDYLLRDAHHVGLKYSFDLDHFLRSYRIIGEETAINECILGLDSTQQAVVTAELFVIIWKSMYDLVYLVQNSRIAEKMLEKAFLFYSDYKEIKSLFELENFVEGNDENMLSTLKKIDKDVQRFLAMENPARLYTIVLENELSEKCYKVTPTFMAKLRNDADALSDELSIRLAEELKQKKYRIICDIIKSKSPNKINLEPSENGEEELRMRSEIVGIIKPKNVMKVYVDPTVLKETGKKKIQEEIEKLVEDDTLDNS
ncbi:MAG: HD domain-containing protein [Candidatus Bathyarchaeota archaeon]|nr:HD domain-containing protein [Candidatus Termiticorpusculum sp.]